MGLNWFDFILIAVLLITLILGFIKGLIRQVIGILAVVGGLILASLYYSRAAKVFHWLVANELWSNLLGFIIIFIAVLIIGWLIGLLFSKLMKGPFKFLNHFLGGIFGLLKGILICGVIVFAFLAFPVDKQALKESRLAPYCYKATRAAVILIPQEFRDRLKAAYQEIVVSVGKNGQKI
jgi:membrane protein required for colicin V production